MKIVKKILLYGLLAFLVFFVSNGIYENIYIQQEINDFKNAGDYESEEMIGNTKVIYYKVSRETYVEKGWEAYERPTIKEHVIGSNGDILLNKKSPFDNLPFIYEFISFFFGGHAVAAKGLENGDSFDDLGVNVLEVAGNTEDSNYVREIKNNWFLSDRREETIGVRVKGVTKEDTDNFTNNILAKLGEPYNYSFIFNTKKSHYCTDLMSKCYQEAGFKINDWFYTSINDLITSKNTYISFYKYNDGKTTYVYYLG